MNFSNQSQPEEKQTVSLRELTILATQDEKEFDDVVKLAALVCQAPISLISMLDEDQESFRCIVGSCVGNSKREETFCNETIREAEILVVSNALNDFRFSTLKIVQGPEQIRFYAGVAILFEGKPVGTLCVQDHRPRELSSDQRASLKVLAKQICRLLELRLQNYKLQIANEEAQFQKKKLRMSNYELYNINKELFASEEKIKENLKQISELQSNLELREKQYRDLVETANDLIYELDGNGFFTFVNSTMVTLSEYSRSELLKRRYVDLVHPKDRQYLIDFYVAQVKERRETSYLEFRMLTWTGKEVWIGQNVKIVFDENNWAYRIVSVSRDISALKITERKLEDSERLYRLLSSNSKDLISLFDIDENVTRKFVSPSALKILGYSAEELIGKSGFALVHPDDLEHVMRITRDLTLHGQSATIEYRAIRKDGDVIWLESSSSPIFDSEGRVSGFQTSARDITRRKEFEASLKEAKKKAEEATLAKSQFLSMMSHEIRTPMNAIIGLTTLMLQNEPRTDQLESLQLLKFSGENLLTIVNDILDFSKIEANKIALESVEVDLHSIVFNTKQMLEQRAVEKGISFNQQCDPAIPKKLIGDPVRIAQVLTNLAGNAIKFTESGSVDLIVKYNGPEDGNHRISFEVRDTGIGIAPENVQRIFERFSQAEAQTTRKYGGTGLGLSITKNLLSLMDSKISLESAVGVGSKFSFELKMRRASDDTEQTTQSVFKHVGDGTGIRVLLAEDNKVNQIVARGFLDRWGISLAIANNGLQAVDMVKEELYHLVLMDLQMPEMDGYEASRTIRNMQGDYFTSLPIIALTASAMLGMKDKVLDAGMTDFVSKPFSPEELHAKILKYASGVSPKAA